MKFLKWFITTNPIHIGVMLFGYLVMFLIWGEDGASDRQIALPIWSFIFLVLIIGKYRYWTKALKDKK